MKTGGDQRRLRAATRISVRPLLREIDLAGHGEEVVVEELVRQPEAGARALVLPRHFRPTIRNSPREAWTERPPTRTTNIIGASASEGRRPGIAARGRWI